MILFRIGLILSIHRCDNNRVGKKSDVQISKSDVSLTIKEGTLTKTNVTLIVNNNSDKKIQYGDFFEIEIKKHGEWHKIDSYITQWFNLYAVILDAGESREIVQEYDKLKRGKYRIIKDMEYIYENGKHESFNVAIEFTIK